MTCDLLVFAPHPDDAEIHCGGCIASHVSQGARVIIIDATRGELGSRGTPEQRAREAEAAAAVLGLSDRENLDLGDGSLRRDDLAARGCIVDAIRRHRPQLVLSISPAAQHPDHRALGDLVIDSIKAAALHQLPEQQHPAQQRQRLLCYEAELVAAGGVLLAACDESAWQTKMQALACYGSQLHNSRDQDHSDGDGDGKEAETAISKRAFQDWIEARGRSWGYQVGAPYAEAFTAPLHPPALADLRHLWPPFELR